MTSFGFKRFKKKDSADKPKSENKKVKNARTVYIDNIEFLSVFESECYKLLKSSCLKFSYTPEKVTIWKSKRVDNVYVYESRRNIFDLYKAIKPQDSTYTPDFVIYSHDGKKKIYIEIKGKQNDVFPIKRKMFYTWMQEQMEVNPDIELRYAFIKNKGSLKKFIDEISKDSDFGEAEEIKLM